MSIVLQSTGGGQITLLEPTTASNFTQTLPAASGVTMVSGNMPAFSAYMGTAQALSAVTQTKLQYNTENFDTNSNYDNVTNYRFTPTVAGYYQINACFYGASSTSGDFLITLRKNGTDVTSSGFNAGLTGGFTNSPSVSGLIFFNGSTDYVEMFAYVQSAQTLQAGASKVFSGVLVRNT